MMVVAEFASASHPRPKGATPFRVSIVPAYNQCTAPNRTHGPPLAFPSCNPPVQSSNSLTIGSPDANGAAANGEAFVKLEVIVGVPGPPDDSDVAHHLERHGHPVQGRDDRLRQRQRGRRRRLHRRAAGQCDDPDHRPLQRDRCRWRHRPRHRGRHSVPRERDLRGTASTAIGGTCTANTSANATVPGAVKDGKRALVEIGQIQISDGGPDGLVGTSPNTLFGVQGIFIP